MGVIIVTLAHTIDQKVKIHWGNIIGMDPLLEVREYKMEAWEAMNTLMPSPSPIYHLPDDIEDKEWGLYSIHDVSNSTEVTVWALCLVSELTSISQE